MTDILDRIAGKTVASVFLDTVAERADDVAICWKDGDDWKIDLGAIEVPDTSTEDLTVPGS